MNIRHEPALCSVNTKSIHYWEEVRGYELGVSGKPQEDQGEHPHVTLEISGLTIRRLHDKLGKNKEKWLKTPIRSHWTPS